MSWSSQFMAEENKKSHSTSEWSSQVYKLSDFLDIFQLPKIIKVNEGYLDENEEQTLSVDDVLVLRKYETTPMFLAISSQGEEETIPLTCAVKVDRVLEEFSKNRLSGGDILHQLSKVKFVRVVENDTEVGLTKYDKLKVKYKTVENHGTSFSFLLSTLTKPKKVYKITEDCKATFQAVLDAKEYRVAEVVRNFGLPSYVWFVNNYPCQGKFKNSCQPVEKVLKLQGTFTETLVVASTLEDSNSVIKLPKDLEITVCSLLRDENQGTSCSELSEELSNLEKLGKDTKISGNEADAPLVYEDMAHQAKETEIASLQQHQITREIKQDTTGNLKVVIPNNYTPTPLVKAISNRNRIYDRPNPLPIERRESLQCRNSHELRLYDNPRLRTKSLNERDKFAALFQSQSYCQEYAPMDSLLCSSGTSSAACDDVEEHIYQEIVFRELPEEMKGSRSKGKETPKSNEKIVSSEKILPKHDKKPAPSIGEAKTELEQNSNAYKMDRKIATKGKSASKSQAQYAHEAIYENCHFQEGRLSDCQLASDYESYEQEELSPPQKFSGGVCFRSSSLGNAISDALLKNKLFAAKAERTGARIPPEPPPRTTSRKPEIPEEELPKTKSNDATSKKKKGSHTPLPEPPKTSVRRSVSAAANIGSFKEKKNGVSAKPLPVPKARSQSMDFTEALQDKGPASNLLDLSKTASEKTMRPLKPLVPPKTSPKTILTLIKTKFDENEEHSTPPRNPQEKKSTPLCHRKPASLPQTSMDHPGVNKTRTKLNDSKGQTETSLANRSQSLNELDAIDNAFVIPEDLRSLGVSGVAECLKKLKMDHLVDFFSANQIDGEMLLSLDDDILTEMDIEKFHRLKLVKFISGWRPMM